MAFFAHFKRAGASIYSSFITYPSPHNDHVSSANLRQSEEHSVTNRGGRGDALAVRPASWPVTSRALVRPSGERTDGRTDGRTQSEILTRRLEAGAGGGRSWDDRRGAMRLYDSLDRTWRVTTTTTSSSSSSTARPHPSVSHTSFSHCSQPAGYATRQCALSVADGASLHSRVCDACETTAKVAQSQLLPFHHESYAFDRHVGSSAVCMWK